jgi:hypothetical protein
MGTHRPAETTATTRRTPRTQLTRRLVVAVTLLALAMALVVAVASSALAATAHPAPAGHGAGSTAGGKAVAEEPRASGGGVSPAVPLVFAGIVILAASGPWLPPRSRYVYYRVERRW